MNFLPRHGIILPITNKELKLLLKTYATFDDSLIEVKSEFIKNQNVVVY
ncbi:hypothetical protein [Neotamlana nanhaiensis]|nr:hypothetical protein [Tamlana nanhaiensis]